MENQGERLSQALITCNMQKLTNKSWWILSHDPWPDHHIITPPLNCQVMYDTNLALCASYENGTSASRELHWVDEAE